MSPRSAKLLQGCIDQALAEAPGLVMRWCNALQAALRQQEAWTPAPSAKAQLATALKELAASKEAWMERWPTQWRASIQEAIRRRGDLDLPRKSLVNVSFDDLELMDELQIQTTVQAARVEHAAQGAAGSALSDLTALLTSLQGFSSVRHENNPLRPEVAISAQKVTMESLTRDAAVRNLWLQHGSEALGQELQILYRQLVRWLTQQGVKPADYHVVQADPPQAAMARQGAARYRPTGLGDLEDLITPQAVPQAQPDPTPSSFLTLDYLHDLVATTPGELAGSTRPASIPGVATSALPMLDSLSPLQTSAPMQASPQVQANDGHEHLRALASEVVNLMLEGMSRDSRMLPGVMSSLRKMRPALLRIAGEDPRFFVDRANPARRLLDDITQHNLAVGSVNGVGYERLCSALDDVALLLDRKDVRVVSLFETAIDVLGAVNARATESVASDDAPGRAAQSLVEAEQRQLLAQRMGAEMAQRPDFAKAAPLVQHFLKGPWALVIAQAKLHGLESVNTQSRYPADVRFKGAVSDLIWSSRADVTSQNRARLTRLIPGLLRTIREGLSTIGFEGDASRQFFARLMALHEAGLKGEVPAASALEPVASWPDEVANVTDGVWIKPNEAAATGLMSEPLPTLDADTDFQDTIPLRRSEGGAAPHEAQGTLLDVGTWVELRRQSGDWIRLRLAWVSPHGLMYLFSGATGRTSSMSRRHFETLGEAGRIRLVATQSMVDDALDSVLDQALINSARQPDRPSGFQSTNYPDLLPPLA